MKQTSKINLTEKQIEEIAEELDCGFRVLYHLKTKEVKSVMDMDDAYDIPEEAEEEWNEIEENWGDYFEFEKMESHDSFKVMEDFTDEVKDEYLKRDLIKALNRPKPFWNFKYEIDENGEYREQWFAFKRQKMIEWVRNQVERNNG